MESKFIIGIDPGITGAIAIFKDKQLFHLEDMPTFVHKTKTGNPKNKVNAAALASILRPYAGISHAILEQVASSPQMGVSSAFSFGQAQGIVLGVLGTLEISYEEVAPGVWKRAANISTAGAGLDKEAARKLGKDLARSKAIKMFPIWEASFALKKHDGRADAVMIGYFGK